MTDECRPAEVLRLTTSESGTVEWVMVRHIVRFRKADGCDGTAIMLTTKDGWGSNVLVALETPEQIAGMIGG